jgi:molecular chaperone DnaK
MPPAPRGVPQIEVAFDIDANGIMHVAAKDKATGKEQSIRIESSSGLSREEIDKMVRDAESHRDDDSKKRERVETRNKAEQLVYQSEKQLSEEGEKLSSEARGELEKAFSELKETLKGEDTAAISSGTDRLEKAWHVAATELYQKASEQQQADSGAGGSAGGDEGGDEGAVDADYEVVDED